MRHRLELAGDSSACEARSLLTRQGWGGRANVPTTLAPGAETQVSSLAMRARDVSAQTVYRLLGFLFGWPNCVAFFFTRIPAIPPNSCKL